MTVDVRVPEQYMGEVNRDLNGRRGRVLGMDLVDGMQVISAHVPQSELFSYATELRSLTAGRGTFSSTLDHYEDVPAHLAEKIIETHRRSSTPRGTEPGGPQACERAARAARSSLTSIGRVALASGCARDGGPGVSGRRRRRARHQRAKIDAALVERPADDGPGRARRLDRDQVLD